MKVRRQCGSEQVKMKELLSAICVLVSLSLLILLDTAGFISSVAAIGLGTFTTSSVEFDFRIVTDGKLS